MAQSLKTPLAILSYAYLFTPQKAMNEGEKDKYSCVLVFLPEEQQTPLFKALKKAAVDAAIEKWGDKAPGMIRSGKLKMPFRDDAEEKGYPEDSVFITVKNERKPGIVSIFPDPDNDNKPLPITDPEKIYAGCIVRATVRAFAYDAKGNKGVSFGLNNIQKVKDGERLDGRKKAEDDFESDMDAVGDLSDLDPDTQGEDGGEEEQDDRPPKGKQKKESTERWSPTNSVKDAMKEVDEGIKKGKRGSKAKPAAAATTKGKAADEDDLADLYE